MLLTALVAAVAVVLPTTGASARPTAEPVAPGPDRIEVTVHSNIGELPDASGTPDLLVRAQPEELATSDPGAPPYTPFAVTATFTNADGTALPYDARGTTELAISSNGASLTGLKTAFVPVNGTFVTFEGLNLPVANDVVLTVTAVDRKAARSLAAGSSALFDVVTDIAFVGVDDKERPAVISKGGYGVECEPTPEVPICVDVVLPAGLYSDDVFFSTGSCQGLDCRNRDSELLQVLADLGNVDEDPTDEVVPNLPRYTKQAPATLVVKCDKTLCGGGGIQKTVLRASLEPRGALEVIKACAAKGVIGVDQESCVDYVQSKRDGSGDTYLYWLITRDARFSI